jgi:hypothetical protein
VRDCQRVRVCVCACAIVSAGAATSWSPQSLLDRERPSHTVPPRGPPPAPRPLAARTAT